MIERNKKISLRERFLIDNQPHDHEWDSPYEEVEYFSWGLIFNDVYDEVSDSFVKNKWSDVSDESLLIVFKLLQTHYLGKPYSKDSMSQLEKEIFDAVLLQSKDYLCEYYEYKISEIGMSEVFGEGMPNLINNYKKESYNEASYFYSNWWVELEDDDEESYPVKNREGLVKVVFKDEFGLSVGFSYWNGKEFDKKNIITWCEIDVSDMDIYVEVERNKSKDVKFNRAKAVKDFLSTKKYSDYD